MQKRISARHRWLLIGTIALSLIVIGGVALAADPGGHIQAARDLLAQADAELQAAQAEPLPTVTHTETITATVTETQTVTVTPDPPPTTTTTTPPPPPPPPPAACDVLITPSADPTALRTDLQAVPNGTAADPTDVCFVVDGQYTGSQQFTLTDVAHVYYHLRGATITNTNTAVNRQIFNFTRGTDVLVEDGTLVGNFDFVSGIQNAHCVNMTGLQGGTFRNLTIRDCRDDGVRIGMDASMPARTPSRNILVQDVNVSRVDRHALSIVGAEHVTIRGGSYAIDNVASTGGTIIDIEPLGADFVNDVLIENARLENYAAQSSSRRSIQVQNGSDDIIIRNNSFKWIGLLVNVCGTCNSSNRSVNIAFTGNVGDAGVAITQPVVKANYVDGLVVTDNAANLGAVGWTALTDCPNPTISGNVDTTP